MNLAFRQERDGRRRECRFRELLVVVVDRTVHEITATDRNGSVEAGRLSGLLARYFESASIGDLDDAAAMRAMIAADLARIGLLADHVVRVETDALVELFALINIRYKNAGHAMELIGRDYLFLSNMIARLQMTRPAVAGYA